MRNRYLLMSILALMCGAALASSALATETAAPAQVEHEGVPLKPAPIVQIGKFAITNSMLVTWIVSAGIIVFAQTATRRIKPIPSGLQNFWEWLVESLYNFLESIIGRELVKKTFWFFATIFIFILFVNWFGLLPGVGTIGWGHYDPTGNFHIDRPLLRGGNADLNMTTAMAARTERVRIEGSMQRWARSKHPSRSASGSSFSLAGSTRSGSRMSGAIANCESRRWPGWRRRPITLKCSSSRQIPK